MLPDDTQSTLIPSQTAVLLIFMPPKPMLHQQQESLTNLADSLQTQLHSQVRVLRIDEATHPDVVRSFAITQTPAFVLIRQGVEIWRQEGLQTGATLSNLVPRLLLS